MCIRRLIRRWRTPVQGNKTGVPKRVPLSLPELIGKSVHISLTHLHYDGRLAAQYELYGHIIRIDESAIVVGLSGSQEECRLRPDPRIFNESIDAELQVSVGSVGIAHRNDLTGCLYLYPAESEGRR
jgi:hypothetical protein